MDKHTPTPWALNNYNNKCVCCGDSQTILADCSPSGNYLEHSNVLANAAFIVKSVNCHEELVGALKDLLACDLMRNLIGGFQFQIEQAEQALRKAGAA